MIDITGSIRAEQRAALLARWDRLVVEPEFRRAVGRDPRSAIEERLGIRLPASVAIGVDPSDPGNVRVETRRGGARRDAW